MRKVTKDFIKDQDISLRDIERKLHQIAEGIRTSNRCNLTDINVICEEIFGTILNRLFALELKSVSAEVSGNYAAVDLIDYGRRIAFQVTSRRDRAKIQETIETFDRSADSVRIDSLNILILGKAPAYREPLSVKRKNGASFSFQDNVIDHEKLVELIRQKAQTDPRIIPELYDIINMVFDSGRLRYFSIVKQTAQLMRDESISDRR